MPTFDGIPLNDCHVTVAHVVGSPVRHMNAKWPERVGSDEVANLLCRNHVKSLAGANFTSSRLFNQTSPQ